MVDHTHDPAATSWVAAANADDTDFPLQNLPLGVIRAPDGDAARIGVAIGEAVLDVRVAYESGLLRALSPAARQSLLTTNLDRYLALSPFEWRAIRHALFDILVKDGPGDAAFRKGTPLLVSASEIEIAVPATIGDYTDFYASIHHATNVGTMLRPDNPLLPNYKWIPIGYHGRASSIVASGTPIKRPTGQTREDATAPPVVGPTKRLDYEVEVGFWIGGSNAMGTTVPIREASDRIAGLCLLNDWSARDVQGWEYQPLGPFLAKNFASTISPWLVTSEALLPFRTSPAARAEGDPAPLPYLQDAGDAADGAYDISLECWLRTPAMRSAGTAPFLVSRSNLQHLYWTPAQLVTHHAMNGCNLRPGDLLGSGTVSGPEPSMRACLLERTWRGTEPLQLPTGETRRWLEDGDELVLRARADRPGARALGFGDCAGVVTA